MGTEGLQVVRFRCRSELDRQLCERLSLAGTDFDIVCVLFALVIMETREIVTQSWFD